MQLLQLLGEPGRFKPVALPAPSWERTAIVRDPVERFLSAYRNRVLHYGDISAARMKRRGVRADLPIKPDLETFVANLAEYRKLFPIRHHTNPQTHFLGHDINYFQRVFCLDRLGELTAYLSQRAGREVELPHLRNEGPELRLDSEVSPATLSVIAEHYRADYEFLRGLYDPPSVVGGR